MGFDFSTAFPTLIHKFISIVLRLIEMPPTVIGVILSTMTAPNHFCVAAGVVRRMIFIPASGIGHGDPFSSILSLSACLSFCTSSTGGNAPRLSCMQMTYVEPLEEAVGGYSGQGFGTYENVS